MRTIVLAMLVASAIAGALLAVDYNRWRRSARRATVSAADAAAHAIDQGRTLDEALDTAASVSGGGSATVYDAAGRPLKSRGDASADAGESVCRSATFRTAPVTVCVATASAEILEKRKTLALLFATALTIALVSALLTRLLVLGAVKRKVHSIDVALQTAIRERSYSTRVPEDAGPLAEMTASVNTLLEQIHETDVMSRRRATEIEAVNKELESFAYAVSHDLRGPLGSINGFVQALADGYGGQLEPDAKEYVGWIMNAGEQMSKLVDGLLQMSRLVRSDLLATTVDLSSVARSVADALQRSDPSRNVSFVIAEGAYVSGDERLMRAVVENLMSNAWKFTRKTAEARIEFGFAEIDGTKTYFVRDNGAGFEPSAAAKIFRPFERVHSSKDYEGTGIGLATVQKILQKHGGKAWAEGEPGKGATIYFTLG